MPEQVSSSENHAELMAIRDAVDTFGGVLANLVESTNTTLAAVSTTMSAIAATLAALKLRVDALDVEALTEEVQKVRLVAEDSHARSVALQAQAEAYIGAQTLHAESYLDRADTPPEPDTTPPEEAEPPVVPGTGQVFTPTTFQCQGGESCQL